MQLKEGWLERQFENVKKNVEDWPEWMKIAAGFKKESEVESGKIE